MRKLMALACAGVFCWVLSSQAQVTTATVSGTVTDSTGAVLPGVSLVILNEDTGVSRTVQTDAAGRYSAPTLPLGNYRVTASVEGFQTEVRRGIQLTLGRQAVVDLRLAVGAITQTVEITGEAPLVQTTEATVGYLVEDRTIQNLPLNGRDLQELVLLNPTVAQAMYASSDRAYAGFGKKISIAGLRAEDNAYLLDGSFIGDFSRHAPAGPSGALLGAETVREFQVLTNPYNAQYGRLTGGVFNAVSKSGTNEWHGSAYEYLRNSALDANRWEDNTFNEGEKPPFRRNQFGATLGGPVQRDRSFFFLAYEGFRESLTRTRSTDVPDLNARRGVIPAFGFTESNPVPVSPKILPFLNVIPLPSPQGRSTPSSGTQEFIFTGKDTKREDFGQARLDYNHSENDSFFFRLTASGGEGINVSDLPMFQDIWILQSRLLTASYTRIVSPRALNTFAASYNRVDPIDAGVYPEVGPELISVPGQPTAGVGYGWEGAPKPLDRHMTNRFNYKDDVNLTLGGHALQFGGMLERMQFNVYNPNRPYGAWSFADIEQFLRARPRRFRGTPPRVGDTVYDSIRGLRQWFLALYLQDDWRITPRLSLSLGVRWEPYTTPTEVNGKIANLRHVTDPAPSVGEPYWKNRSWGNFGPRIGFAWTPFESGKTSVRGGFGIFFVPNDPALYYTQATRSGPFHPELRLERDINPDLFPDAVAFILAAGVPQGSPEALEFENLQSPRTYQYNLTTQQQFGENMVVSVGYIGNHGLNAGTYADFNTPVPSFDGVSLAISPTARRTNPNFEATNYYSNGGSSWYNGLAVSLQRRFAAGLQAAVSYTWSKAQSMSDSNAKTDRSGSTSGGLKTAHFISADKSVSGYHLGQKLSFNYSYDLPLARGWSGVAGHLLSGWQVAGIVTVQDGQPFDIDNASGATPAALSVLGYTRDASVNHTFPKDKRILGGPDKYFDPEAFYLPNCDWGATPTANPCEIGNVGRNTLIGPGIAKWDFSLNKNTSITERWRLQFRAEFFNLLNRPNFGKPATSIFTSRNRRVEDAGRISSTVGTARQIQFGLKLMF